MYHANIRQDHEKVILLQIIYKSYRTSNTGEKKNILGHGNFYRVYEYVNLSGMMNHRYEDKIRDKSRSKNFLRFRF